MPKSYNYLFSQLIICTQCNKKFRGKLERRTASYIDATYNNQNINACSRKKIVQEDILFFVNKYCEKKSIPIQYTNEFMKSIIKNILVNEAEEIVINYIDGTIQEWTNNKLKV